ncbi:hypothetical protein ACTFIU_002267 [Dictyostelium citrinum]
MISNNVVDENVIINIINNLDNHTNNNNNNDNNNKCYLHPKYEITFLCSDCELIPCCIYCLTSDKHHRGHKANLLDETNIISLIENFKNNIHPTISETIKNDKNLLVLSNNKFNQIKNEYDSNMDLIENEFKNIHNIINLIEDDLKNQLLSTLNDNSILYSSITKSINNYDQSLSHIVNSISINNLKEIKKISNENENENENENINNEINNIIKKYQQSILILKDKNINQINHNYKNNIITINNNEINNVKDLIKSFFSLKNKNEIVSNKIDEEDNKNNIKKNKESVEDKNNIQFDKDNYRYVTYNGLKFYVYSESYPFPFDNDMISNIAFGNDCGNLSKFKFGPNVNSIILLNGFNQFISPGTLPDTITTIHCFQLNKPLIEGSIPKSVKFLTFNDGFDQLLPGIISNEVVVLSIHDIKKELMFGSIPNTIKNITFGSNFNQVLLPGILPEGIQWLDIHAIKKELIEGSIPNSVKCIALQNGFDQSLLPGIIPESVEELHLGYLKQPLLNGSIPKSVKKIILSNEFNQSIDVCNLSDNVKVVKF